MERESTGMLQLSSCKSYWSHELRCARIADAMPLNRYQELLRYLHFVNNDSISAQNKLAKIHPLIAMAQEQFVKRFFVYDGTTLQS